MKNKKLLLTPSAITQTWENQKVLVCASFLMVLLAFQLCTQCVKCVEKKTGRWSTLLSNSYNNISFGLSYVGNVPVLDWQLILEQFVVAVNMFDWLQLNAAVMLMDWFAAIEEFQAKSSTLTQQPRLNSSQHISHILIQILYVPIKCFGVNLKL